MRLIVALCKKNNGIGKDGDIPWYIKEDLKYFKDITCFKKHILGLNTVIMGRKTWESIPDKFKPLKSRVNIILSKTMCDDDVNEYNNTYVANSLDNALNKNYKDKNQNVFIIGGAQLYNEAINHPNTRELFITEIYKNYECDTFFPKIEQDKFKITSLSEFRYSKDEDVYYRNLIYTSVNQINMTKAKIWINNEEKQYINLLRNIVEEGVERNDRTNVGTLSVFGERLKYDLRETFPLLTTKRMFVRAIFEELMLYISGRTDNKILQEKNIHIWDGNTTREFLDSRGLTGYPEGDMGETYGFNFRHYGAEYNGCDKDYTGQGFDQIQNVINLIKNDPTSRRMLINLFNPATQHKAALPACLCQYQFYVNTVKNELNLQIYLRSSDFFLANNWNACTGAFLVHMICNLEGIDLTPGDLTVITGDTHIYKSHIDAVKENMERIPLPSPKLVILNKHKDLRDFVYSDMKIIGYHPYPSIKAEMAV
jgi:dihydrofolate reductase / thymidylate synthase